MPPAVRRTLDLLLKHEEDIRKAEPKIAPLLAREAAGSLRLGGRESDPQRPTCAEF